MTETQEEIRVGDEVEVTIRGTVKCAGAGDVSIEYVDVDGDTARAEYLPRESARLIQRPVRVGDVVDESTPEPPAGTVLELPGNGDDGVARVLVRGCGGWYRTASGGVAFKTWEDSFPYADGAKVLTLGGAQ